MPLNSSGLSAREKQLVSKLVEAGQAMEAVYWEQMDPEGLRLMQSTQDMGLKRFLQINGGRWDLLAENAPFGGAGAMPPGHALYPAGWSRERIEAYVKAHPEQKAAIYNPYTVVREKAGRLETIPYSKAYATWVNRGAVLLREAAGLSDDAKFAKFLRLKADALQKDDYYESDLAWMDLEDPKFDVIMGPYETYLDELLGVKASFSSALLMRNDAETRKLKLYERYVPDVQDALPVAEVDRPSKKGHRTPMEVMDAPFRTGDLLHGYQAVADNLPNDPRIHEKKGSKKLFFKNFMDARVNLVILPLAKQVMRADQAAKASGDGYMAGTVMHEMAHGLGPAFARVSAKQVPIGEAIGPAYAGLEEAKADVAGMFGLEWLMAHGAVPKEKREEYYASYMAGILRSVRFGDAEPHSKAELMEFNFMMEQGAFRRENGKYFVDYGKIPAAMAKLSKELLEMEATGDRGRVERWFGKYGRMSADLKSALAGVQGVPVDVEPIYDFPYLPRS